MLNIIRIVIGTFFDPKKGTSAIMGRIRAKVKKNKESTVAGCKLGIERSRER
jgi:hypothetical protein